LCSVWRGLLLGTRLRFGREGRRGVFPIVVIPRRKTAVWQVRFHGGPTRMIVGAQDRSIGQSFPVAGVIGLPRSRNVIGPPSTEILVVLQSCASLFVECARSSGGHHLQHAGRTAAAGLFRDGAGKTGSEEIAGGPFCRSFQKPPWCSMHAGLIRNPLGWR